MDADQIFATGGASGITAIILYLLYKFFSTRHSVKSKCCGKEVSIETADSFRKNSCPEVDEEQGLDYRKARIREGRSGSSSGQDVGGISLNGGGGGEGKGKEDSSTDGDFTRENPILKSVPQSV